jgi:hypothetical protein
MREVLALAAQFLGPVRRQIRQHAVGADRRLALAENLDQRLDVLFARGFVERNASVSRRTMRRLIPARRVRGESCALHFAVEVIWSVSKNGVCPTL